jgi:uncharacterized membrane protein YbhN (UPF0104 family)
VPAGIGIVEIVLITALASAGLHDAKAVAAVAAVLLYGYHFLASHRRTP